VGLSLLALQSERLLIERCLPPAAEILVALLLDVFALCFIINGFVHAILLRSTIEKFGLGLQILGLCCSWVCDTGALVMGSALGRIKLAPTISPGKTVVGAAAGVASSVATVLVLFALPRHVTALRFFLPPLEVVPVSAQIALGLVLGVLCILGDLVESFVKRLAGVKDSGAFFPGHGGCLDRMDSFLFVAPCLYYYARYLW
jgi:phosphatidate cytidylyltransferase